jgi:hypothetical protein
MDNIFLSQCPTTAEVGFLGRFRLIRQKRFVSFLAALHVEYVNERNLYPTFFHDLITA